MADVISHMFWIMVQEKPVPPILGVARIGLIAQVSGSAPLGATVFPPLQR
jgi:hypothetical protein